MSKLLLAILLLFSFRVGAQAWGNFYIGPMFSIGVADVTFISQGGFNDSHRENLLELGVQAKLEVNRFGFLARINSHDMNVGTHFNAALGCRYELIRTKNFSLSPIIWGNYLRLHRLKYNPPHNNCTFNYGLQFSFNRFNISMNRVHFGDEYQHLFYPGDCSNGETCRVGITQLRFSYMLRFKKGEVWEDYELPQDQ